MRSKRSLGACGVLFALALVSCVSAVKSESPAARARRPVPRPQKLSVTRRYDDGRTVPSSMYAVDASFNLLSNGFFFRVAESTGVDLEGPTGHDVIPPGREIFNYITLRIDVGAPGGARRPVDFIVGSRGGWALALEPDDYPYSTIPSDSPTHVETMGPYRVVFVEGEPVELDVPEVGTLTFVPWLVESIDAAK